MLFICLCITLYGCYGTILYWNWKPNSLHFFCYHTGCFYGTFLTTSRGRHLDDIDLHFFANCRRSWVVFFLYATCGHLFFIFSWKWKLNKGPILRKMHSSVNIDNAFFWQSVIVLSHVAYRKKLPSFFYNLQKNASRYLQNYAHRKNRGSQKQGIKKPTLYIYWQRDWQSDW